MSNKVRLTLTLMALCLISSTVRQVAQTPSAGRYLLQPNDTIDVKYRFTPQFNESLKIAPDGHVMLTLAGDLKLSGLSLAEATVAIQFQARTKVVDPEVSLILTAYEKPYFVVAGQVANPGHYDMSHQSMSLVEVIALAGGFKSSSKTTEVLVYHRYRDGLTFGNRFNVKQLMEKEVHGGIECVVRPGDVIVVPQNKFSSAERVIKLLNLGVYYPLPQ